MRRSFRLAASAVVVTASLLARGTGGIARADEGDARDERALDLFEKSETAYESGRFADAIALLQQSYELKKEPVLLYNLGRAYEGIGDLAAAARSYEAFLAAQPDTQDRGALERRVATLRRQLAERESLRHALASDSRPRRAPSAVPWVFAGFGAAGLAAGGVLGVVAGQRNDDAKSEPTYLEAERLHSQAETFATIANVGLIAGGILLVGGVIWGLLDVSAAKTPRQAQLPTSYTF